MSFFSCCACLDIYLTQTGSSIKCYQCSAAKSLDCADGMIHMGGIEARDCSNVFEAQYCIKSVSLDGIKPLPDNAHVF